MVTGFNFGSPVTEWPPIGVWSAADTALGVAFPKLFLILSEVALLKY